MLVIPSVSIGNAPQLACDLLIHTYDFRLVSTLDDELLSPFVGPMDYTAGSERPQGFATGVQLFKRDNNYIVQIRSPPLIGQKAAFVSSLHTQLKSLPSDEATLVVGSANAGSRANITSSGSDISEVTDSTVSLPDSGFVRDALKKFHGSTALVAWTYEGDNIADALHLSRLLAKKLQLPAKDFKQPVSWSRLYGKDPPLGVEQGIYT